MTWGPEPWGPLPRGSNGIYLRHVAGDWPVHRRNALENAAVSLNPRRWPISVTEPTPVASNASARSRRVVASTSRNDVPSSCRRRCRVRPLIGAGRRPRRHRVRRPRALHQQLAHLAADRRRFQRVQVVGDSLVADRSEAVVATGNGALGVAEAKTSRFSGAAKRSGQRKNLSKRSTLRGAGRTSSRRVGANCRPSIARPARTIAAIAASTAGWAGRTAPLPAVDEHELVTLDARRGDRQVGGDPAEAGRPFQCGAQRRAGHERMTKTVERPAAYVPGHVDAKASSPVASTAASHNRVDADSGIRRSGSARTPTSRPTSSRRTSTSSPRSSNARSNVAVHDVSTDERSMAPATV